MMTNQCRDALGETRGRAAVEAVAVAYLDFGSEHPAVYEAMFQQPIGARFAADDTSPDLRAGFDVLAEAFGDQGDGSATEVFWSALHGISELAACAWSTDRTASPSSASASLRTPAASATRHFVSL